MKIADRRCLVCDCEGTMRLDPRAIARALGAGAEPVIHTQLCRSQLDRYQAALATGEPLLVACTQEAPLFAEVAGETAEPVLFANIRERAGWSDQGDRSSAKIAALLAEAVVAIPPAPALTLRSEGRCLVYGEAETALEAAKALADRLAVTLLLPPGTDSVPPSVSAFPILRGRLRRLTGHLGTYRAEVEELASPAPSSRQRLRFVAPMREPGVLEADLVLDLSGGTPLFPAHERRDGYLRPDPRDPAAVARALLEATALVGEFEKPRYIHFSAELCAHSRSRRTGCTRCLDLCPTGAITPAGDHVAIDPFVCAGCGACAGICPTGAAAYASPGANALLQRLGTLLATYGRAGGEAPVLLIHEARHGDELIAYAARLGRGLPARVLPFAVGELAQLGLETLAGAFAYGAAQVVLLVPPRKVEEVAGLHANTGYLAALLDGLGHDATRLAELATDDPDELEEQLWSLERRPAMTAASYLPMGGNRALMRLAFDHLHATAPATGRHGADAHGRPVRLGGPGPGGLHALPRLCRRLSDRGAARQSRAADAALSRGCLRPVRTVPEHLPRARHSPRAQALLPPRGPEPARAEGGGARHLRPLRQALRHEEHDRARGQPPGRAALDVPDSRGG